VCKSGGCKEDRQIQSWPLGDEHTYPNLETLQVVVDNVGRPSLPSIWCDPRVDRLGMYCGIVDYRGSTSGNSGWAMADTE
jgi:hypothetical protein